MRMQEDWRARLKRLIDETPGLSMKTLSLKAGLGASTLHDILKRGRSPSIDVLIAVAAALGMRPSQLIDGDAPGAMQIPITGIVGREVWTAADDAQARLAAFDIGGNDTITLEVRGNDMAPVYRDGDVLFCNRQFGPNADNLIGLDCALRTASGDNYIKILKRGSRPGRFNLKSYNPAIDDIEDVALQWVAPVAWIKRGVR